MTHKVQLLSSLQLTHDTWHYLFSRPVGYSFTPGQATELSLDQDGWRDEGRPFTFVSDPTAGALGFIIKSYTDHEGVTARLPSLETDETVLIGDPWGAIEDKGPGVFIAAGAGITPFIPILKARARKGTLDGCRLIYANTSEDDVILRQYWSGLRGLGFDAVLSDPKDDAAPARRVDAAYLDSEIEDWGQRFYLCGPPGFEDDISDHLKNRGVSDDRVIREG